MTTLGNHSTTNDAQDSAVQAPAADPGPSTGKIRGNSVVASYSSLLKSVRDAGLLQRRRRFYVVLLGSLGLLLAGAWTGFAFIGDSWFQLLIAGALGLLFTQFAFWSHEAAHNQVFASRKANAWTARIVGTAMVGMSYAYWMDKHNRHHGRPNTIDKDPDIKTGAVAFYEDAAATKKGLPALITRRQGYLLFPLILFLGITLHIDSFKFLMSSSAVKHRWLELCVLFTRFTIYMGAVFFFLPLGMAFAFIGTQLGVFGFYMGASFAPNHKGMPILPSDTKADFLSRQVLTSRNITGGWFITVLMGGLNYQIEHHLFPDMPRSNLRQARTIVLQFCRAEEIAYTETSLLASYGMVVRYLNRVGLSAADPFECPLINRYRG